MSYFRSFMSYVMWRVDASVPFQEVVGCCKLFVTCIIAFLFSSVRIPLPFSLLEVLVCNLLKLSFFCYLFVVTYFNRPRKGKDQM